jgi:hypothetical protein
MTTAPGFDAVWQRILELAGEEFRQVRGGVFSYIVDGNHVIPTRTNHRFARSQIEEAFNRMPVSGPSAFQDLRGPSYLFAILTDPRVSPATE